MSTRPMSLRESHESTGEISLRELFDNHHLDIDGRTSEMGLEDLIFAACRGGWPGRFLSVRERSSWRSPGTLCAPSASRTFPELTGKSAVRSLQ